MTDHSTHSSLREAMLEHLFLSDLMRSLWRQGARDFEVLHAVTDNSGYDVVVEARGILRHIQLKSSFEGARLRCRKSIPHWRPSHRAALSG